MMCAGGSEKEYWHTKVLTLSGLLRVCGLAVCGQMGV